MQAFWSTLKTGICHIWGPIESFTRAEMHTILFDYIATFHKRAPTSGPRDRTTTDVYAAPRTA